MDVTSDPRLSLPLFKECSGEPGRVTGCDSHPGGSVGQGISPQHRDLNVSGVLALDFSVALHRIAAFLCWMPFWSLGVARSELNEHLTAFNLFVKVLLMFFDYLNSTLWYNNLFYIILFMLLVLDFF